MMLPLLLLDQGSSKTSDNTKLFLAMAMSNPNSMQNPQSILPFLIRFDIVFKKILKKFFSRFLSSLQIIFSNPNFTFFKTDQPIFRHYFWPQL